MRRFSRLSVLAVGLAVGWSNVAFSQQPAGAQTSATGEQSANLSSELPAPQSNASQSNATQSGNTQPNASQSQSSSSQSNNASGNTNATS